MKKFEVTTPESNTPIPFEADGVDIIEDVLVLHKDTTIAAAFAKHNWSYVIEVSA